MRIRLALKLLLILLVLAIVFLIGCPLPVRPQQTMRTIVADDFTKARPKPAKPRKTAGSGQSRKNYVPLTSTTQAFGSNALQVGVTVWKVERVISTPIMANPSGQWRWISKRVAADTRFSEGDLIRLSIESPRAGYLYVINRDLLSDGSYGATNLIFPASDEDNRLEAGKLIDIPAEDQSPFRASPGAQQAGELLTILVTSTPITLLNSDVPQPISPRQLLEWGQRWGGPAQRFELDSGAGQLRTGAELEAASRKRARTLTRDDPPPQTIFLLNPPNNDGLLFNFVLSYVR